MRDLSFGERREQADIAAAKLFAAEMRLVRLPWPRELVDAGRTGARCLALSARTGAVYEGYCPYGEVYGWRKLT